MTSTSSRSGLVHRLVGTLRTLVVGLAMAILVGVLVPVSFLYDRFHRTRSRGRTGAIEPIPRVPADQIDPASLLDTRHPMVIEGLADRLGVPSAAGLADLRAVASRRPDPMPVRFYDSERPYFLYTGDYGATVTERDSLPLEALLDLMFSGDGPDDVVYQLFGERDLDGEIARILDEMGDSVEQATGRPALSNASGVWVGSTGATTPLHHDSWPGLLFQTHGTKRVAMYAPDDRPNLYFNFPLPVGSRWSELPPRSAEASPDEYPLTTRATRYEAVLGPGDVLLIPSYWAHEMEALEANISVPLRIRGDRRDYLDPGFLRPAAEVMQSKWTALLPG